MAHSSVLSETWADSLKSWSGLGPLNVTRSFDICVEVIKTSLWSFEVDFYSWVIMWTWFLLVFIPQIVSFSVCFSSGMSESKIKVWVVQWWLTLCDPVFWGPPGSSVHGIHQAINPLYSRISHWSGLPFLPPGDLANLGTEPSGLLHYSWIPDHLPPGIRVRWV